MIIAAIVSVIATVFLFGWALYGAKVHIPRQSVRLILGLILSAMGLLLSLRGGGVVGMPLAGIGLGLLGALKRKTFDGQAGGQGQGQTGQRSGQRSTARADMDADQARSILGVGPNATDAEIKKAYLALMKKVHPDQGGSNHLAQQVQTAYEVLSED